MPSPVLVLVYCTRNNCHVPHPSNLPTHWRMHPHYEYVSRHGRRMPLNHSVQEILQGGVE